MRRDWHTNADRSVPSVPPEVVGAVPDELFGAVVELGLFADWFCWLLTCWEIWETAGASGGQFVRPTVGVGVSGARVEVGTVGRDRLIGLWDPVDGCVQHHRLRSSREPGEGAVDLAA